MGLWAYKARVAVRPLLSSSMKDALHGTDLPYFVWTLSGLAASICAPPLAPYHIARNAMGRMFFLSGRWSTEPWSQRMPTRGLLWQRDCTISTSIEVKHYYTKREHARRHQKCSPVSHILLHKGRCDTRKRARVDTPTAVSFGEVPAEEKPDAPIIDVEDILHRCLPIHNDLLSGLCVLDRIRLVRALIS